VLGASAYLLGLALMARRVPAPATATADIRFDVIVPAHNEEGEIAATVRSLRSVDYPPHLYRVIVVADNCTDGTAAAARRAGAEVLERHDAARRGKGYAIGWALERLGAGQFDAVVIVDADSVVAPEFLKELNLQMERGDTVIQCYNGVANPGQSWFTRLMHVSRTIANEVIHPGKRKLGLSSHLMGNGMCFDLRVLSEFGWNAFSAGEDWEYYARLVLNGIPVGYSRTARVFHQESVTLKQASSQRLRWSSSRFQVLRQHGFALFWKGVRTRSATCIDAALPLVFPNPSLGINLTVAGLVMALVHTLAAGGDAAYVTWFGALAVLQLGMFVIGALYTEDKVASAASLFVAPAFLAWKMGIDLVSAFGVGNRWKPTQRRA
jgi:cellulose synthase/poly-beta-1,6-N-acetylglucosamine synthase-like glycosyltransferase